MKIPGYIRTVSSDICVFFSYSGDFSIQIHFPLAHGISASEVRQSREGKRVSVTYNTERTHLFDEA